MNITKLIILGITILIVGIGIGYTQLPTKIKIEEKIVEKIVHERDEKTTKEYDPITGKVIKETIETKDKETSSTKTDKTVEKEQAKKVWAVKGGISVDPRDLSGRLIPRVGAEMRIPLFGLWLGAEGDVSLSRPSVGLYGRMEF